MGRLLGCSDGRLKEKKVNKMKFAENNVDDTGSIDSDKKVLIYYLDG